MKVIEFKNGIPVTDKVLNGFYEVQKKQNRNGRFLKKYWKLIEFTMHHMPEDITYTVEVSHCTKEMLHEIFKELQGVDSIAFGKMSEEEFEKHYSNTLDHCCKLLGTSEETVIKELVSFM